MQLDPSFAIAWARLSRAEAHLYFDRETLTPARRDAAKRALENAQRLEPDSPETLLALGYYQYRVLRDYGQAKTTFDRVSKMLPGSSEVPRALGTVARSEGHWDQSIAYFEQALALDPRNVDLLTDAALTYVMVRQFPAALKLYDRALDITPNDPETMAEKARIYQAQGNLQEAARFLAEINEQTPNGEAVLIKITQLRLERNYGEAVRLLQARLAQFHFASELRKGHYSGGACFNAAPCWRYALAQRLPLNRRAIRLSRSTKINQITVACSAMLSLRSCLARGEGLGPKGSEHARCFCRVLRIRWSDLPSKST